ncbi:hypothetical protein ARMGADRAFT_1037431 [Armillaria gallica]|uniref:HNH nuclease domain-containing protein n=1 Tax=Armillaria gallica TaxID=47427 RepID=A0A2H3CLX3_ARMGA|nr:hypothetical protein ARMGADRAFT_1037431 [Armillaria gallica]
MLPAALALSPVEATNGLHEKSISAYNLTPTDSVVLIHVLRILGYMIIHSPSSAERHQVVKKLSQLGQTFVPKSNRTPDFQILRHPSSDEPGPGIQEALKAHKEAKDLALVRDGFRCIVTGIYDRTTLSEVSASPRRDPDASRTDCAHIVPESTYFHVSDHEQHEACAKVVNLSGAAQYNDKLDRDVEDMGVLAENGSAAEVLIGALLNRTGSSLDA